MYLRQEISSDSTRAVSKDFAMMCIKHAHKNLTEEEITNHLKNGVVYKTKYATYSLTGK